MSIVAATKKLVRGQLKTTRGNHTSPLDPDRGSIGGPTSATGPRGNKFTTTNLAYPTGVETDNTQGHYIIFEIMAQKAGQLEASKKTEANLAEAEANAAILAGGYGGLDEVGGNALLQGAVAAQKNRNRADAAAAQKAAAKLKGKTGTPSGLKASSLQLKKPGTTVRMDTMIALYMPPSVQVSYELKYGDQEIGRLAETGGAMLQAFQSRESSLGGIMSAGGAAIKGAAAGAVSYGMDKAIGLAQGADALVSIARGQVITPRMELLFEGVGRRNFSYSFVFIPKSEQEAETIAKIVKSFKFHMAPEFANNTTSGADGVREMTIPDHFNIRYMYKGQENPHLNKISTCALTKMDVDYGAERFTGYADGRPQTTKISLNFQEFNIMDKAWMAEGY